AWNAAIVAHFAEATPAGLPVFLAASEDALAAIAQERLSGFGAQIDAQTDFLAAVRDRVLRPGGSVDLTAVGGTDVEERPAGAAFLCTLVLAAGRMGDD